MARRNVMSPEETQAFQGFLRSGLRQYRTSPAKAGKWMKRKTTALDVYAEQRGIQKRFNPLVDSGFTTTKRVGKMIENALTRPVPVETARLALFALHMSAAAAEWRFAHGGWEADEWDRRLDEHRKNRVSWAAHPEWPKEGQDPFLRARVALHPGAIETVAAAVIHDLYERKFLSKPKMADASAVVAEGLQRRLRPWSREFLGWVSLGDSQRDVKVTEETKVEDEGFSYGVKTISVRGKGEEAAGRPASHAEFLEGILCEVLDSMEQRSSKSGSKRTREMDPPCRT
jgi:hypothetical protein